MKAVQNICAVRDVIPSYRRGLMAALKKVGYEVAEPEDVVAWLRQFSTAQELDGYSFAVLHSIREDGDVETLQRIQKVNPDVCTIALVLEETSDQYAKVLNAGASGAVYYGALPTEIIEALSATRAGAVRLPQAIVADFAKHVVNEPAIALDDRALRHLNKLAGGQSIAEIARDEHASERTMHRRLNSLYRQLGASNRYQALVAAARQGFITLN